ncbi:hypothetical protein CRUP_014046 [Coryphaenoides rupestris]|nr:hypothetical protein CRUP_014046 [Coryphaenoides rupestris]
MYQGAGEGVVAMVLKELPGKKTASAGNPLLTVTTKRAGEQQEIRPLLSPSIDDFLSESRVDGPAPRPVTSNTAVSLSSPLDRWEDVNVDLDAGVSRRGRHENKCSSNHSSSELLWSAEFKTDPSARNTFDARSLDEGDLLSSTSPQDCGRQRRRARSLLASKQSLEDEFVKAKAAVESDTEFWDKMQAEWEELARRNWLDESESDGPLAPSVSPVEKGYYFHTDNPYREVPNAFSEGQERAREGDLNTAVLLLEAAILQDPQDAEAWQVLGMTQAENENEQAAIRHACHALHRWLAHNPRYKHLLLLDGAAPLPPGHAPTPGPAAATSSEFHKAVEAFTAALSVRPQDYLLWNRLGATLANGDRSEEAVEAYSRALQIQPGFIRSRYNLGISCINLGFHREAASNFLTALRQQRQSQRASQPVMSANIWAALRIALSMMEQPELLHAASLGDLDLLMRAFDMEDV